MWPRLMGKEIFFTSIWSLFLRSSEILIRTCIYFCKCVQSFAKNNSFSIKKSITNENILLIAQIIRNYSFNFLALFSH